MAIAPMSRYLVLMRAYERRVLKAAIADSGASAADLEPAADLLGIHRLYLKGRCTFLGGVIDDTPHEPPLSTAKETYKMERRKETRREAKASASAQVEAKLDAPAEPSDTVVVGRVADDPPADEYVTTCPHDDTHESEETHA